MKSINGSSKERNTILRVDIGLYTGGSEEGNGLIFHGWALVPIKNIKRVNKYIMIIKFCFVISRPNNSSILVGVIPPNRIRVSIGMLAQCIKAIPKAMIVTVIAGMANPSMKRCFPLINKIGMVVKHINIRNHIAVLGLCDKNTTLKRRDAIIILQVLSLMKRSTKRDNKIKFKQNDGGNEYNGPNILVPDIKQAVRTDAKRAIVPLFKSFLEIRYIRNTKKAQMNAEINPRAE